MRNKHNSDLVANTNEDIRLELLRTVEATPYFIKKTNNIYKMKKTIFVFFFPVILVTIYAQSNIQSVIKDSLTTKGIPFVNIAYLNLNIGTISDEEGFFSMKKNNDQQFLQLSALGYRNKVVDINKIDSTIYLSPKIEQLNEIVVYGKKNNYTKNIKLGLSAFFTVIKTHLPFGYEFASYIENKYHKKGIIKEVLLSLNKTEKYDFIATYNVKFYSYDSIRKQPGTALFEQNIFVKPENKTYKLKINVENYNISLPKEGVCVGIELVNVENFKTTSMSKIAPAIIFTYTNADNLTWTRFMNKKWGQDSKHPPRINDFSNASIVITANIER
jgi:hypothetical protein